MPFFTRAFLTAKAKTQLLFSDRFLLCTNTTISVVMSCLGDGLQQRYQLEKKEIPGWNKRRSRDVGITGLVIGPFCHTWYRFLDLSLPGRGGRTVLKKLVADQLVCSPVCIASFLILTSLLEGQSFRGLKKEIAEKSQTLYTAEWLVWPPVQVVNFCLMPPKFRVLFDNTVSFGFDWYFSYIKYCVCADDKDIIDEIDKNMHSNFSEAGKHVPFLHMQAGDIIQLKQKNFHITELWRKCCAHRLNTMTVAMACNKGTAKMDETLETVEYSEDSEYHDASSTILETDNIENICDTFPAAISRS